MNTRNDRINAAVGLYRLHYLAQRGPPPKLVVGNGQLRITLPVQPPLKPATIGAECGSAMHGHSRRLKP